MQNDIKIKIGDISDLEKLAKLDYTNTENKVFNLSRTEFSIKLSEEELEQPRINQSEGYQTEITKVMIPMLGRDEVIALVACIADKPIGYLMAFNSNSPQGKIIVLFGLLVSREYSGHGAGKALIEELIGISKKDTECKGIQAEMGTDKYTASKLLLNSGFVFSGAELYVYSNNEPTRFSKECIHFYFKF